MKDNINKIDEQINDINNLEKKVKSKKDDHETIIDEKYKYDDIGIGDTKKIDSINDVNEVVEETKKLDVIDEKAITTEAPVEPEPLKEEKPKKKKSKLPIFIIIGICVLILIIVLIIVLSPKKSTKENEKDKKLSKNEQKEVIKGYGDALKGILAVYFEKQNVMLEYDDAIKLVDYDYKVKCNIHEIYEDGSVYLNKCSINGTKTKYSYGKKKEKEEENISEDAIKVYVSKKNGQVLLKEPSNVDDYDIYSFEIDGKYSDLTLLSNTGDYIFYTDENYNVHMLNFKTGKKVLDYLSYSSVLPIKVGGTFDTKYIAVKINDKWGIYNISNNERTVSNKYDSVTPTLSMGVSGPAVVVNALDDGIIAVADYGDVSQYGIVDYKNGKEIIKQEYKTMLKSGDYLWAVDNYGDGHIFDYHGAEYLKDSYDKVYWAVDGKYILVNDNKEIKVVSIKGKVLYNYGKLKLGKINYGLSYNNGALFQFDNPGNTDGSMENGCIELIYDASTSKGEVKDVMCGGIAKPVLYLYPKKTTKVEVSFEHPEFLQTTYPKYNGKWSVKAHSNGDLYDNNGAYYYALYWDEAKVHNVDFSTGYYVEKDDAIEFLEKKLAYIGLSRREANEFIMYWLPILEKNDKNLVYFELTEERESYNKININPKPDSLLRLVIHIKKVDHKVEIPKQNLTRFQRKGFVAVEWGGTIY